jgi:thiamine biosynthesis lipoprotein
MIHVFETMGTVVSLSPPLRAAEVEAVFAAHDARFSLYHTDSELSRIRDGSLALVDADLQLREAYALALEWRSLTNGAFTPHRPDGVIDLSGIVKALAIDAAGTLLDDSGDWILNCGGDVLTSGQPTTVGIIDPLDRAQLLTSVRLGGGRRAVATSGSAERGDHIWGRSDLLQVTVVADDIVTADVLATAIVSVGGKGLDTLAQQFDVDVIAVDRSGGLRATSGFRRSLAA